MLSTALYAGGAGRNALCATLYAGAVEGEIYVLDVLNMLDVPDAWK